MIRVQTIWLALGAQAHHAYVFANRRADRLKS